jgi:hypothetical protein
MGFFSFLKYIFIIFAAHFVTSCGAPIENHCVRGLVQIDYTEEKREESGRGLREITQHIVTCPNDLTRSRIEHHLEENCE